MAAYIVFVIDEVKDPELMGRYAQRVTELPPALAVSFMAGVKVSEVLEGPGIALGAIMRFDTIEEARKWYFSPEYQELVPMRRAATSGSAFILEGP